MTDGTRSRILVALSGGVDSATAAGLLAEQGHPLVGVFMRNGVQDTGAGGRRSCCSLSDARDARSVASRLDIPFYVHDLSRAFGDLIDAFCRDYEAGRTPNPCVLCNNDLKFGELLELADDLGCDGVATGHYARMEGDREQAALLRGLDPTKDQSYLLHGLTREQLARAHFPLGALSKHAVRDEARRLGLSVADKPDSADICFVPGGDYRAVVASRLGGLGPEGDVVDRDGQPVARHAGVAGFTVGQRRGLGVALGAPAYVTSIDRMTGTVTVGGRPDLLRDACRVDAINWLAPLPPAGDVSVQLRHHHEPEQATVEIDAPAGRAHVRFARPSADVTPGQYAVFYAGDLVLGGGRILREDDP